MIHKTLVVGPLQCNCVILGCEKTREAIIIDPGDEPDKILKVIEEENLKVKYLLHTHAHFDHIGATGGVKEKLQSTICLHKGDDFIYKMLPLQGKMFGMHFNAAPPVDKFIEDDEIISFGEYKIQVIHTPGHSPGGVCFKLTGGEEYLFSGDTLFKESIGRTDLWGGNMTTIIKSIKDRILNFNDDIKIFPGHGASTLVGNEKRNNPFIS